MINKLINSVILISLSAEEQKYLLPQELPICEELVLTFEEALREALECRTSNSSNLQICNSAQVLDNEILNVSKKMPENFWFDLESLKSEEWCGIRAAAQNIVREYGLIKSKNSNSKYITSNSAFNFNELPADFVTRKEIWEILSDLFLDTDVALFYDSISAKIKSSNYNPKEIKFILLEEVTPVLAFNIYDPIGEWAGFDTDWLIREIIMHQNSKKSIFEKIKEEFYLGWPRKYAKMQWKKLEPMVIK